jgi:hypothetical protein
MIVNRVGSISELKMMDKLIYNRIIEFIHTFVPYSKYLLKNKNY